MDDFLPAVIDKTIPETWSPEESIEKINKLYNGVVENTGGIGHELWVAAYYYKNKSWLVSSETKYKSFNEYCEYLPFSRATAYRFIDKYTGRAHVSYNSGNNEWYTPAEYIENAREVMGDIHLDPATTPEANKVVQAQAIYTKKDNALERDWRGNVWMNPPYSSDLIGLFMEKLLQEAKLGNITAAIVLVNNATETTWFQPALKYCNAVCFPAGRIHFWNPEKETASPLQGQALLYFGDKRERFKDSFMVHGEVLYSAY